MFDRKKWTEELFQREKPTFSTRCKHFGTPTGELRECASCGGKTRAKLSFCKIHGVCTEQLIAIGTACCRTCPDRSPMEAFQIEVTADGIGDHLLGLSIATAWKQANPDKYLLFIAKPNIIPWLKLFEGYDHLAIQADPAFPKIHDVASRGGLHYIETHDQSPRSQPLLKPLSQSDMEWAESYRGSILLAPGVGYRRPGSPSWAANNRQWLPSHWLTLERLLRDQNHQVIAIDSDAERVRLFSEKLVHLSPSRVAALMKVASLVISNESGMAHFAGTIQVPCLVLSGPLDARKIHGFWKTSRVLQGPLACSGCRYHGIHYRPHCDTLCASLQSIQPEEVAKAVQEMNTTTPAQGQRIYPNLKDLIQRVDSASHHGGKHRLFQKALFSDTTKSFLTIVETGCQRQEEDVGAGMSTTILGVYCKERDGKLFSIDNDPFHVDLARNVTRGLPVEVILADSVAWLNSYQGKSINLLYLDSLDTTESGYQEHCLNETKAALPHLALSSRILYDDTWFENNQWHGKGALAVPYLLGNFWSILNHDYQCLLGRSS